jgi:hypothetical protein
MDLVSNLVGKLVYTQHSNKVARNKHHIISSRTLFMNFMHQCKPICSIQQIPQPPKADK